MRQKQFVKAIEFFNAAEDCPDKPSNHDLTQKREECRKAIRQTKEARRQIEAEEARIRQQEELERIRHQQETEDRIQREAEIRRQRIAGHEYVDLGLSVMWATCNVDASNPEDFGSSYAWGETLKKSEYSWSNYCFGDAGNSNSPGFTKYAISNKKIKIDNKTKLDLCDDVAHINWSGGWRIPTDTEWSELRENCIWTWVKRGKTGGYLITSKQNGNSIFLPAAGYRSDNSLLKVGTDGRYWASTLNPTDDFSSSNLVFNANTIDLFYNMRYTGRSIRAVLDLDY